MNEPTCMYGYAHDDQEEGPHGFACNRESHARGAAFGNPPAMQVPSWFREQLERAKERNSQIPDHARMVIADPTLSAHESPA